MGRLGRVGPMGLWGEEVTEGQPKSARRSIRKSANPVPTFCFFSAFPVSRCFPLPAFTPQSHLLPQSLVKDSEVVFDVADEDIGTGAGRDWFAIGQANSTQLFPGQPVKKVRVGESQVEQLFDQ